MKALIFSDIHLDVAPNRRHQMEQFTQFLRRIDPRQYPRIVILGDLFDFWFEYKHVVFSGYFEVLRALADLRDRGVEFHFVGGNHDFWAGRFLRDVLGFVIHTEPLMLDFDGKRALLVHGDGLNPQDVGYRVYKRIARARPVVWLFRLLHPDWAMALAQRVSRTSRRLTEAPDLATGPEVNPLREFARRELAEGHADIVVCGHSHYPVREEVPTPDGVGVYFNTGDWLYHQSYIEWDGTEFQLRSFDQEAADPEPHAKAEAPVNQGEKQP